MAQVCFEIGLFRRAAKRFLDFRFRVYNVRYTSFYSEESLIILNPRNQKMVQNSYDSRKIF